MASDFTIVLAPLRASIVMFALNRPRMDAVALLMMTVLPFTGVAPGRLMMPLIVAALISGTMT